MIIDTNFVEAELGKILHNTKTGIYSSHFIGYIDLGSIEEISIEQYEENILREEANKLELQKEKKQSEEIVRLIRLKYSENEEFAIHRKVAKLNIIPSLYTVSEAETSDILEKFEVYNRYVEDCINKVKQE